MCHYFDFIPIRMLSGFETSGALKKYYCCRCWALHGLGFGDNAKAAIHRSVYLIARLRGSTRGQSSDLAAYPGVWEIWSWQEETSATLVTGGCSRTGRILADINMGAGSQRNFSSSSLWTSPRTWIMLTLGLFTKLFITEQYQMPLWHREQWI